MVSPDPKVNSDQMMALFNGINKMTINYANGSTLTLEGEALTNFITFQKSMVFLYTTFANATAANAEKEKSAPSQPLTRTTTLGDHLGNKPKKGQS